MTVEADPGANGSHNNQIAVARIVKAFTYLHMTDRWGPIPYTQALKGSENYTPAYDSQESIYLDLFKELKEAVAQVDNGAGPGGDILLGGDMDAWKRFANTQRMVMALRLSKVNPSLGATEFADAVAAGVITSNDENILYNFLAGDPNNFNPWYNNYSISLRNDFAISNTMVDYMKPLNDPRLPVYGEVLPSGEVVGLEYGSDDAKNIPNAYSRIGDFFRGAGSPALVFSYSQVLFSMAEAAHLGWIPGGDVAAADYYTEAIQASWEYYGVYDAAAFATYIAQPEVAFVAGNAVEKIQNQKWIHLYLNGYESWAEWRRTGYPELSPAADYQSSEEAIPRRQAYGTNEGLVNKANYDAAVATLLGGADNLYTRLWWDKP
ncbi:MAG: SusD/RagB family nutrient-binding outer membrane lipoprotein [Pedobacter sp.]|nr:MAG: SusD/RagB family nutrient-binding outer membrane lipoprotein [Pedobacter sp.]